MIYDLDKKENAFQDYKDSASLIAEYKKSDNKQKFKRENYQGFKKFDNAKRNIYLLKKDYNITNFKELDEFRKNLLVERNNIYLLSNQLLKNTESKYGVNL